jgi:hypothetical protein
MRLRSLYVPALAVLLTSCAALLAEQLLRDMPLYTFNEQDFRYGGAGYFPSRISARPGALVVTFEPVR